MSFRLVGRDEEAISSVNACISGRLLRQLSHDSPLFPRNDAHDWTFGHHQQCLTHIAAKTTKNQKYWLITLEVINKYILGTF